MNNFGKVLITAGICIAAGGAILIGVAATGGGKEVYEVIENGGIGWSERGFVIGSTVVYGPDEDLIIENGKEMVVPADEIDDLYMELKAGVFEIKTDDTDQISIRSSKKVNVEQNGNRISIETPKHLNVFTAHQKDMQKVEITLPKEKEFHTIDLEVGAGELDADALKADTITVEVGAGRIEIDEYRSKDATICVGAGEVIVKNGTADEMDLDVGMGDFQFDGSINQELDADCGMGNMELRLTGEAEDHNYEVDCGMGSVSVGDMTYGGMASGQEINNGADSDFDLDCGMGNISIQF